MPTLETLVTSTYRDLADEDRDVFSLLQVEDFVRGGMVELNRISPQDSYDDIDILADTYEYATTVNLPYRVELRHATSGSQAFPEATEGHGSYSGWTFRKTSTGGMLELPKSVIDNIIATDPDLDYYSFRVYGYVMRPIPYTVEGEESPETGLNGDEEYAVREYAKSEGFNLLTHDRSLYQQWQGQTNNSDVSPVMMMNMAAQAKSEWMRRRGILRTVRRYI